MIYKMLPKLNPENTQIMARIDDDGVCRVTCTENDQAYLKWLEEGNTPIPAEENT
jgi:hypothetical protein